MGEASQTVMGPEAEYCPTDSSMRKTGSPTKVNMMAYGIRKAPETSNDGFQHFFSMCLQRQIIPDFTDGARLQMSWSSPPPLV